jgi:hypothetical protein
MTTKEKARIASAVLEQLEPLHADDPEVDRALKEAGERAAQAARKALEAWVQE